MTNAALTFRDLRLRSVVVPLARPPFTRVVTIEEAAFLLLDLETEEGITGRAYLFGYSPAGNACFVPALGSRGTRMRWKSTPSMFKTRINTDESRYRQSHGKNYGTDHWFRVRGH
jgi:hypothetical protein